MRKVILLITYSKTNTATVAGSYHSLVGARYGNPLQYSCLENPHEQKSLVGYSPWGHKESDMTERLGAHIHICAHAGVSTGVPGNREASQESRWSARPTLYPHSALRCPADDTAEGTSV